MRQMGGKLYEIYFFHMNSSSDIISHCNFESQRANGIDPDAGGEYTCRKCKGNKTTHYAMQTRSADEPMTVFVGCLTCGNRWRCT